LKTAYRTNLITKISPCIKPPRPGWIRWSICVHQKKFSGVTAPKRKTRYKPPHGGEPRRRQDQYSRRLHLRAGGLLVSFVGQTRLGCSQFLGQPVRRIPGHSLEQPRITLPFGSSPLTSRLVIDVAAKWDFSSRQSIAVIFLHTSQSNVSRSA
jgi:hypothetical protein